MVGTHFSAHTGRTTLGIDTFRRSLEGTSLRSTGGEILSPPTLWMLAFVLAFVFVLRLQSAGPLGLGGEVLLLAMSFGFISDLTHGQGDDHPKPGGRTSTEDEIRLLLDALGDSYYVIHDVDSPEGNIGNIVLARVGGVFLIEIKPQYESGQVENDDLGTAHRPSQGHIIDLCTYKTAWLRDRISELIGEKTIITPLLVFPNPFVPKMLKVGSVRIINQTSLLTTLAEYGARRRKSSRLWEARQLIADSLLG